MTPAQLEAAARRLYADPAYRGRPAWQAALARGLGVGSRWVRRWAAGDAAPDRQTAGLLRASAAMADRLRMWEQPPDRLIVDRLVEVIKGE
jgi:hypothetical protein